MSNKRVLVLPSKVVLGRNVLNEIGEYASMYGKRVLLIAHEDDRMRVSAIINKASVECGVSFVPANFSGECSMTVLGEILAEAESEPVDLVVGLGGGKAIDMAKLVADRKGLPMFSVPTIASTDAPCSSLAITYDDDHYFVGPVQVKRNPALVLIDTEIIANAPERFLVAGMGDAFPTFFEARASRLANVINNGGVSTLSAYHLAKLCLDTLLSKGEEALIACRNNVVTSALEDIIEVNIVMSGIGFESVGVAAAHGLTGGLEVLGATKAMHGEVVAFGALVQLVLENAPHEDIETSLGFFRKIGLPVHLADLGIEKIDPEKLCKASELACDPHSVVNNMPFPVTPKMISDAIITADKLADVF